LKNRRYCGQVLHDAHSGDRIVEVQKMKLNLTDFCLLCRKWLIVALLAVNLSGCAGIGGEGGKVGVVGPHIVIPYLALTVALVPVAIPIMAIQTVAEKIDEINGKRERKKQEPVEALAPQVRDYLKTACEKDERLFVKPGIALDEGILVLNKRRNALLPLLKSAPKGGGYRELQYGYAISWDNERNKAWEIFPSSSAAGEKKFFVEYSNGKIFQRNEYVFWEQAGLREQVFKDSPQMQEWRLAKDAYYLSEAAFFQKYGNPWDDSFFDLPVDAPDARYALLVEDISTLEDRAHWVARGKITLMERNTGEVVAEYVGFEAHFKPWEQEKQRPWKEEKSPSRNWDYRYSFSQLCPSVDSDASNDRRKYGKVGGPSRKRGMVGTFLMTVEKGARETVPDFDELLPEKKR
jgi:hypothetical protein